jgi:hypothetical protein
MKNDYSLCLYCSSRRHPTRLLVFLSLRLSVFNQSLTIYTLIKKENQIFHIYKEILIGAVAKSYPRKGFLIYKEMRKYFPIYEEAVSHIRLCNCSILNFLIYEEKYIIFFYQCTMLFL